MSGFPQKGWGQSEYLIAPISGINDYQYIQKILAVSFSVVVFLYVMVIMWFFHLNCFCFVNAIWPNLYLFDAFHGMIIPETVVVGFVSVMSLIMF